MRIKIASLVEATVRKCVAGGLIPDVNLPYIEVEIPNNSAHGDYASNVAMILASQVKQNPRKIAGIIQANLADPENILEKTQIAGPGFINFYLKESVWQNTLQIIQEQKEEYGRLNIGGGQKVQVEFVSANPTGPLHIGHARGAVVGDVIANLLKTAGYAVDKEYYINDAGNQMNNLGKSVLLRYRELLGEKIEFPEIAIAAIISRTLPAVSLKKKEISISCKMRKRQSGILPQLPVVSLWKKLKMICVILGLHSIIISASGNCIKMMA
jgi:arginyl-tRNA synthetase